MIDRIEQPIEPQKIPGALLSPKTIDEILKEPQNPLRTEYLTAIAIVNWLHHEENKQLYFSFIECKTEEEREERAQEIAHAYYQREKEAKLLADSKVPLRQPQIIEQPQFAYPQLIPILIAIVSFVHEWQNADTTLQKNAANHQAIQTWHVNHLIQNAINQTVTLDNGRVVSIGLDPDVAQEIHQRMDASKGLVHELDKIPVLKEQWQLRAREIAKKEIINDNQSADKVWVAAQQQAANELKFAQRELLGNVIQLVPDFARNLKQKLGTDYDAFAAKYYPKKKLFEIADMMLRDNIDFDNWGRQIQHHNNSQIENNFLRNKYQRTVEETLNALKGKTKNDNDFQEKMKSIFDAMTPEEVKQLIAKK